MRYADPTNDLSFRKIFGDEHHQDSLTSLINAVLGLTGDRRVASVTIANPYLLPRLEDMKETIVDVKAKDGRGQEFIVEMQCKGGPNWVKRAVFNTCKAVVNQLDKGTDYRAIHPVYFIGILKFEIPWNQILSQDSNQPAQKNRRGRSWLTHHVLKDKATNLETTHDFSLHFLELPVFDKKLEDCETVIEKWAWFFKNGTTVEEVPHSITEPGIIQAFETAETLRWSRDEWDYYQTQKFAEWQIKADAEYNFNEALRIATAKATAEATAEATKKGKAEGKAEGLEQGKAEGLAEGLLKTKRETAKQMHVMNLPIEMIAQVLQVSPDVVTQWLSDNL